MIIEPFVHRCIVPDGAAAGNKHEHIVTASDIEFGGGCEVCRDVYYTDDQLLAHIYRQLTEPRDG